MGTGGSMRLKTPMHFKSPRDLRVVSLHSFCFNTTRSAIGLCFDRKSQFCILTSVLKSFDASKTTYRRRMGGLGEPFASRR